MDSFNKEKALIWINQNWRGDKRCPICLNSNWAMNENLTEVRPFQGGSLILGGQLYPFLLVTCNVCGYTHFFNAVIAGVINPHIQQEKQELGL